MSTSFPLSTGLPPPSWALGTAPAAPRPAQESGADWFGSPVVAHTLTARRDAGLQRDVDGWAQALMAHLTEPPVR